nr:T9SS type A sorting domain-containing protein [Bacteroidota bacterium]
HMRLFILLLFPIFLFKASAQGPLYFDPTVPVQRQGTSLDLAWAGGLNFVQTSSIDLNGDDLKDLFLFDRSGNKVVILLNTGGTGTAAYTPTRQYDDVFPFNELHDWALLRDYNCDGKEDIFSYSQAGFSVYRNISDGNGPAFELAEFRVESDYVTSSGGSVIANLFISLVDLPGIVDVDGDGDLDVLTFSSFGSYMEYHKNLSMETYGNCDSLNFELRNKCWGFFRENVSNNNVILADTCDYNVPDPEMPQEPGRPGYIGYGSTSRAHAGSSILPLDLDGNGLMDLLLGDFAANNLIALYNEGSLDLGYMTDVDTQFPNYDQPVDLSVFPAGFYEDVNNDGLRDLIVSPNTNSLARNFRSMWFYENTNSDADPVFEFQTENLFQDRMLEFGEGASPVLFDHNDDGLMDLIVANYGYYQSGNTQERRFALLKNIGTAQDPAFDLADENYLGPVTSAIDTAMYPAFGDVDGDGDKDLYIGDQPGMLHFALNTPIDGVAQFQLQGIVVDAGGSPIDVGQFATPIFHDLDQDGLLDLLVGERNGNLNYYRNTGTSSVPQWTLVNENIGGVSTVQWWNVTGHSVPFMFEDASGDREMILGSESGWMYHYDDIDGNVNGQWNLVDSTFLDLYEGSRTTPVLFDMTGDGALDLVVGNYRGGLSFWRSDDITTIDDRSVAVKPTFTIQPNPASNEVDLILDQLVDLRNGAWVIRNSIGQEVVRLRSQGLRTTIPISGLSQGVYHVTYDGASPRTTQRLMVITDH